jgi:hypothetical protein
MAKWTVETRVTIRRIYTVEADCEGDALDKSLEAEPDYEDEQSEENVSVTRATPEPK